MLISERTIDNVTIVDVAGRLTMNEGRGLVKGAVDRVIERGSAQVVLNLEGLKYIDSACLGELIQAHAALCRKGGRLKLVRTPDHLHELLRLAGLEGVFDSFATEAEAARSFSAQKH
jgi:anti-sigma B factor antagonist